MIRAIDDQGNLIVVITRENFEELQKGAGVIVNLREIGYPKFTEIIIAFEETTEIALEKLRGGITSDTQMVDVDCPEGKPN